MYNLSSFVGLMVKKKKPKEGWVSGWGCCGNRVGHSTQVGDVGGCRPQDTAAALGRWLADRRARDTSTVARFLGPRLAGDALTGNRSPPPPPLVMMTAPPPPPLLPFFNMARPHTWFTKLLI